jgi:hypothetical protein
LKPVRAVEGRAVWTKFSEVPAHKKHKCLQACRALTEMLYPGLHVEREIQATNAQRLGDTILLWDAEQLIGFGVCHCGPDTEAGVGKCYVKFGVVRPGPKASEWFECLLDACEALAVAEGLSCLEAGVNLARHEAYCSLLARGFRTDIQGVAMCRPNQDGYNQPGVYLIDDWR